MDCNLTIVTFFLNYLLIIMVWLHLLFATYNASPLRRTQKFGITIFNRLKHYTLQS